MLSNRHAFDWRNYDFSEVISCVDFANTTRVVYGPNMKTELILDHIKKISKRSDSLLRIPQLTTRNKVINMLLDESKMEIDEVNGTNFFIVFVGALLAATQELMELGYAPADIIESFNKAVDKCHQVLDTLKFKIVNKKNECVVQGDFNITNWPEFELPRDMQVFKKLTPLTKLSNVTSPTKIVVYACSIGYSGFLTNSTMEEGAKGIKHFKKQVNELYQRIGIAQVRDAEVIVTRGKFDHFARYFIESKKLVAVTVDNMLDLYRVSKIFNAEIQENVIKFPEEEEMGTIESVLIDNVGGNSIAVFKDGKNIIIVNDCTEGRSSNENYFGDNEFVPGGGATEMELARQLILYSQECSTLHQLPIIKFAFALQIFPRTLAASVKVDDDDIIASLTEAHNAGKSNFGFVIEEKNYVGDAVKHDLFDLYRTKHSGLKRSVNFISKIFNEAATSEI